MAAGDLDEAIALQNASALRPDRRHLDARPGRLRQRWARRGPRGQRLRQPSHHRGHRRAPALRGRQALRGRAGGQGRWPQLRARSSARIEDAGRRSSAPSRRREVRALLARSCARRCRSPRPTARARGRRRQRRLLVGHGVRRSTTTRPASFCESNVLRYRPLPGLTVRVAARRSARRLARVLLATAAPASPRRQPPPDARARPCTRPRLRARRHLGRRDDVMRSVARLAPPTVGAGPPGSATSPSSLRSNRTSTSTRARRCCWAGSSFCADLREQAVSRTLHRYGNVVRPFDEHGEMPRRPVDDARAPPCRGRDRASTRRRPSGSPRPSAALRVAAQASLTAVTSFCNVSLASPKSIVVFGS